MQRLQKRASQFFLWGQESLRNIAAAQTLEEVEAAKRLALAKHEAIQAASRTFDGSSAAPKYFTLASPAPDVAPTKKEGSAFHSYRPAQPVLPDAAISISSESTSAFRRV